MEATVGREMSVSRARPLGPKERPARLGVVTQGQVVDHVVAIIGGIFLAHEWKRRKIDTFT